MPPPLQPEFALPDRIVVAGSGIAALSAALAMRRFVPSAVVMLVEPRDERAEAGSIELSTRLWPIADAFHARIGITPEMLLRSAGASVHVADRFERWSAEPWMLATNCSPVDDMLFQHWLREPGGTLSALMPYVALGERDRVAPDLDQPLRIDQQAYRALLSRGVEAAGVERIAVPHIEVERDATGAVAALALPGRTIPGDWFVDTSGSIADAIAPTARTSALPCDLIAIGREEPPRWSAIDRWSAVASGWVARVSGIRVSRTMMGFASAITDRDQATLAFRTETGQAPDRVVALSGKRRDGWLRNVLAIGDAAIAIDPIGGLGLALVQSALLRVGELLPSRDCAAIETAEFNRRTRNEHDAAHDFVALHYHRARAGPFWDCARAVSLSSDLTRLIDQFARRGRIPHRDDNPVPNAHWRALMVGTGIRPTCPNALTRSLDESVSRHHIARARADIVAAQRGAIPYRAWHDAQLRRLV